MSFHILHWESPSVHGFTCLSMTMQMMKCGWLMDKLIPLNPHTLETSVRVIVRWVSGEELYVVHQSIQTNHILTIVLQRIMDYLTVGLIWNIITIYSGGDVEKPSWLDPKCMRLWNLLRIKSCNSNGGVWLSRNCKQSIILIYGQIPSNRHKVLHI